MLLSKISAPYATTTSSNERNYFHRITLSGKTHLVTVLFKQPELHTLIQLDFLDLPELEELLLSGVDLVQKLHDHGDGALHVRITGHVGGGAVSAGISRVVAVPGFTRRQSGK